MVALFQEIDKSEIDDNPELYYSIGSATAKPILQGSAEAPRTTPGFRTPFKKHSKSSL